MDVISFIIGILLAAAGQASDAPPDQPSIVQVQPGADCTDSCPDDPSGPGDQDPGDQDPGTDDPGVDLPSGPTEMCADPDAETCPDAAKAGDPSDVPDDAYDQLVNGDVAPF